MFRDLFNVALIFGLKIETIYETNSNAHFSGLNSLIVLLFSTIYKCTKNLLWLSTSIKGALKHNTSHQCRN